MSGSAASASKKKDRATFDPDDEATNLDKDEAWVQAKRGAKEKKDVASVDGQPAQGNTRQQKSKKSSV
jgi:hypothetical protein